MNTLFFYWPGNEKEETSGGQSTSQEDVQISLPKIDRPEGPFEHSGETSGWTKEEAAERKEQKEQ
jgi:hypothetical protein